MILISPRKRQYVLLVFKACRQQTGLNANFRAKNWTLREETSEELTVG